MQFSATANIPPDVLFFYAFGMFFLFPYTLYFLFRKQRPMAVRCLVIIGLLHAITAMLWIGEPACIAFIICVTAIGTFEVISIRYKHIVKYLLIPLTILVTISVGLLDLYYWWIFWILGVFIVFFGKPGSAFISPYLASFSILVVGLGAAALIKLALINPAHWVILMLSVQMNDSFSMLAGRKFGRHKPFPGLSPDKSVEGYFGGALGISITFWGLISFVPLLSEHSVGRYLLFGLILWVMGNFGDLLFSKFKRTLFVKDFSNLLPQHGGVLDRFDSLLTVAPIWWLLIMIIE